MKKFKLLNLIVNGSLATQVTAGVVAVTVLGGSAFGGYKTYKHAQDVKAVKLSIENKKSEIIEGVKIIEYNLDRLPEEEDVTSIREGLDKLGKMDLENNLDEAYDLYTKLSSETDGVLKKYKDEMKSLSKSLAKLETVLFNEEELSKFNGVYDEFSQVIAKSEYREYKQKYENTVAIYNELLEQAKTREEANNQESNQESNQEGSAENEQSGGSANNNGSSNNGGSTNSKPNNGGQASSGGSTNSKPNNGGSAPSTPSTPSTPAPEPSTPSTPSTPAPEPSTPAPEPSTPSTPAPAPAPSVPSGWKTDISSRVVSYYSNNNTNVTDPNSEDCAMSKEQYNYYYGICQNLTNGSINSSTALSQLKAQTFDFLGMGQQGYDSGAVGKVSVSGCDFSSIISAIENQIGTGGRSDFVYCTVYYDSASNTSTVTFVIVGVDFV